MKIHFLLIFVSLFLWSQSFNAQIHALEKATPKERVALMNHIKKQLITMNQKERMKTLKALKAKLHSKKKGSYSFKYGHNRKDKKSSYKSKSQNMMQSYMGEENMNQSYPMMNQEWKERQKDKKDQCSSRKGNWNWKSKDQNNKNCKSGA